jgi:capsular polysaccharide biosynthesis protein
MIPTDPFVFWVGILVGVLCALSIDVVILTIWLNCMDKRVKKLDTIIRSLGAEHPDLMPRVRL